MPYLDCSLPYADETETTSCIDAGSTGPDDALYCAEEDTIVFSNELAMNIRQREVEANGDPEAHTAAGNLALAAAMGHLYRHAPQEEWGWLLEKGRDE